MLAAQETRQYLIWDREGEETTVDHVTTTLFQAAEKDEDEKTRGRSKVRSRKGKKHGKRHGKGKKSKGKKTKEPTSSTSSDSSDDSSSGKSSSESEEKEAHQQLWHPTLAVLLIPLNSLSNIGNYACWHHELMNPVVPCLEQT